MHELQSHQYSSFVTLTYDEHNLPENNSLSIRDHQLFLKRLRKNHPVRFYSCGEYGPLNSRPHYHLCLFGYHFPDRKPFGNGFDVSNELRALWPHGNSSVGDLTFESAAYTARYICDKITGEAAKSHYERIDNETGEIIQIQPEFNLMSRMPGIGSEFFKKYMSDMYPHDYVVIRGKKMKPPRFYDQLFEKIDSNAMEKIKIQREMEATVNYLENTPGRLAVREIVTKSTLAKRKGNNHV